MPLWFKNGNQLVHMKGLMLGGGGALMRGVTDVGLSADEPILGGEGLIGGEI